MTTITSVGFLRRAGCLVLLAVACALPALTTSQSYRLSQYEYILALVVLSASLNITTGFAGQLALGQSAVFAVSGYGVVVIANHFPAQTGLLLMILVGCAFGALTGIVIGLPSLRVGGFYLAMITLFAALVTDWWVLRDFSVGQPRFQPLSQRMVSV
jgi:branched-chain amino acid transport system permease protein